MDLKVAKQTEARQESAMRKAVEAVEERLTDVTGARNKALSQVAAREGDIAALEAKVSRLEEAFEKLTAARKEEMAKVRQR